MQMGVQIGSARWRLTFGATAARHAKQATGTIPIVAVAMADLVADELVASLARPGGNVTGATFLGPELSPSAYSCFMVGTPEELADVLTAATSARVVSSTQPDSP